MDAGCIIKTVDSPLGEMTLSSDGRALTGLWFTGQKYFGSTLKCEPVQGEAAVFDETRRWLDIYFSGRDPGYLPELALYGSDFRQRVWRVLISIPYGKTTTYGEIARIIERETGRRAAAQAVGGAVGHNPVSVLIPCHRVLGADGRLTGYAGGIDKKLKLLRLEGHEYKNIL